MRRIVWVAATILIMIGILGYGLYTMRHIEEVNQQRREKEAGKDYASKITFATEATNVWDKMHEEDETQDVSFEGEEGAMETTEKKGSMKPAKFRSEEDETAENADIPDAAPEQGENPDAEQEAPQAAEPDEE